MKKRIIGGVEEFRNWGVISVVSVASSTLLVTSMYVSRLHMKLTIVVYQQENQNTKLSQHLYDIY